MTLIITAINKNGVFIRADKRRVIKETSGPIKRLDDMEKVFISPDKKTIIYNHGINIINGRSWYDLALKTTKVIRHDGPANIYSALDKVESAISADVVAELSNNQIDDFCAFVVILKLGKNKWAAGEISWTRGQGVRKSHLGRFIWSGSGSKYFRPSKRQMEDAHWASIRMNEAKAQIGGLYAIAIKNQINAHGDEFSESYDDVIVT